ncbi:Proteasome subunit alpha type-6 [Malassezia pachydermatis]
MRQLALSSRLMYTRPLPLSRLMSSLADRAQLNTMQYGKRPYGVGFLVIGTDDTGPHLYEFNPTGNCFEYVAMSLGARSQSAKTYLERHMDEFVDADLDQLIIHGIRALRETLPQNKQLERAAVSVAYVGPGADADPMSPAARDGQKFTLVEGDDLAGWFEQLGPSERQKATEAAAAAAAAATTESTQTDTTTTQATEGHAPSGQDDSQPMDEN